MEKIKSFITKIKENKYLKLLSFLIVWILLILVGRMSYAFLSDEMNDSQGEVHISAGEVDKLSFTNGTPLTLAKFNAKTFTTNQTGKTSGEAILTAGPDSIYAPVTYHAYLEINDNTFVYSINEKTPELLLTVIGPNGKITSLPGLKYKTVGNVSGFDITTRRNKIALTPNDIGQKISITSSSPTTTQTWTVKLTFLKQNGDQSINDGKIFSANLILQQDRYYDVFFSPLPNTNTSPNKVTCQNGTAVFNDKYKGITMSQINNRAYCTLEYEEPPTNDPLNTKISSLVGNGQVFKEQIVIEDNSTFTNPKTLIKKDYNSIINDETYPWTWNENNKTWSSSNHDPSTAGTIKFKPKNSGDYKMYYNQDNSKEKDYDYGIIYKNGIEIKRLKGETEGNFVLEHLTTSDEIEIAYRKDRQKWNDNAGNDTLSFYMQSGTYNENINGIQTGIRYEGKNPDNYIWFNNELWRIIGVFNSDSHGRTGEQLVKIIRSEPIGGLAWDKSNLNNWSNSSLKNLLNGAYLKAQNGNESGYCFGSDIVQSNCDYREIGIKSGYREMIENVTWYLGGPNGAESNTINEVYTIERDKSKAANPPTWEGKIGLMYASDYGYSSSSNRCKRDTVIKEYNNRDCAGQSWIYGKGYEWTITHSSENNKYIFIMLTGGNMGNGRANFSGSVRPVLYLKSNVYTTGGTGIITNPYKICLGNSIS